MPTGAVSCFDATDPAATVSFGRRLGTVLKPGAVVAFYGELGAGKTTMIRGVCAGLGVTEAVKSPSFVIVTEYEGRLPVYHIDLYRLSDEQALEPIGLESYLYGNGVCLIEWAERAERLLPAETVRVRMEVTGEKSRRICVEGLSGLSGETSE
ncbi:MAG: tRNA (adenosine(37)-N6)-threonylcarbamoyltransferase complex ATPase subunit type 1 TsaE [candidate division WOR-3 bacterium]